MRLIPIECVRENSILGKSIYAYDGRVLLKSGCVLTKSLIDKVKYLHIYSLYIIDEYSSEEIEDIIKPELRQKAIRIVKETFADIERIANIHKFEKRKFNDYTKKEQDYFHSIDNLAEELISEILNNKNVLLSLVDIKSMDNYTYAHSVNVAVISLVLGISLNLPKRHLKYLCIGALIPDIGKSFIPKEILQKPSRLTEDEFKIIENHPKEGYDFIKKTYNFSSHINSIVLQHHERFDGLGYPNKLLGEEINHLARIVSVADVYDALTSDRPYKRALCPSDAVEYLMSNAGSAFDFNIVNIFSKVIIPFPAGTIVSLSNGDIGIVKETLPNFPLRPIIEIIKSDNSKKIGSIINLIEKLSVVISNIQYEV
ncbi:HD-GYP domain-containing protein [Clostridium neonatale]|uniref:Cyclic di-GMP phosphodiesterase response regulator RpfG n=1 Tax=Clostridium neonatale TaxID=137838 RepID=A0AAD1YHP2_9CLOT|nr:HD-GYP domain-containing protein [Clostridium neonatale]CAI3198476.1 Cyclic di-GMP phosphodiesterase response regulator RpfG [Clostridium neonatale]CAI3201641.1 Cyclic di-GMP phosphodiesterase response regulator RpfG [Clostridium neonatale]CAI3216066.1 Cyclic di-GMP phosphodiesterase response regulator RpfG [Clostridium neonatale]CAI3226306.1 Cyclic di-GMP phosphodiesterase response regulator RpfG [Clostridium neonatale]CAI3227699.1 Cyclic di-GMP phosphodiesterase response regulator RpfG [C